MARNRYIGFTFAFILISCILMFCVFSISGTHVALAENATTGYVGDNLYSNPNFYSYDVNASVFQYGTGLMQDVFYDPLHLTCTILNDVEDIYINRIQVVNNSGTWDTIRFTLPQYSGDSTIAFNIQINGSVSAAVWDTVNSQTLGSVSPLYSNQYLYDFQFHNNTSQNVLYFGLSNGASMIINWIKLERGNNFTGFVNLKYTNLGYYQGLINGINMNWENNPDNNFYLGKLYGEQSVGPEQYQNGYQTGLSDGRSEGYQSGYSAGQASMNDSSFFGLISAVIDAPLQAFDGLLNFEVLGVNLKSFVLSLFTISVILVILKIALGGF